MPSAGLLDCCDVLTISLIAFSGSVLAETMGAGCTLAGFAGTFANAFFSGSTEDGTTASPFDDMEEDLES